MHPSQPEGRRSNNYNQPLPAAPAAPVPPPNPAMPPPLSGAERLERLDKGYRPPENYWEEDRLPLKFPFEGREVPGPPEGMTIPPRQTLPIPQVPNPEGAPPFDFQEKMQGLMDRMNEEDVPLPLPGPARRRMEEREQQRLDDKTDELRNSQPNPETPYWDLELPEYMKRIAQTGNQPPPTI